MYENEWIDVIMMFSMYRLYIKKKDDGKIDIFLEKLVVLMIFW